MSHIHDETSELIIVLQLLCSKFHSNCQGKATETAMELLKKEKGNRYGDVDQSENTLACPLWLTL